MVKLSLILIILLSFTGCTSQNEKPRAPTKVHQPHKKPQKFTKIKIGKPYEIMGKWYTPQHEPEYDEQGIASWYGPGFHGRLTANGEKYDQKGYSAAHTTLPMPSIVRVTNLDNGKALNVRVNDRGPFHPGRIIDLSEAAARDLDIIKHGVGNVRVQYLPVATEEFIQSKGKRGDELRLSNNHSPYQVRRTMNPQDIYQPQSPVIVQDIKSLDINKVGTLEAAPYKQVDVMSLPDVTPAQFKRLDTNWIVQVASYGDAYNAQKMMSSLRSIGDPLVQEVSVNGRQYFRVMLKPSSSQANPTILLTQLEQQYGISDAKVITP